MEEWPENTLNPGSPGRKNDKEESAERLTPGQTLTEKLPVLHYGGVPHTTLQKWSFRTFGLVENPSTWSYEEFLALLHGKTEPVDIHCVTRWSKFANAFEGIPFSEIYDFVKPKPEAEFVLLDHLQCFATNLPL